MEKPTSPPKGGGGRPLGRVDSTRDYPAAVARMRELIAGGASDRGAARAVKGETGIPESTLRRHLAPPPPPPPPEPEPPPPPPPEPPPPLRGVEFDAPLTLVTPAEYAAIQQRQAEKEAERAASRPKQDPAVAERRAEIAKRRALLDLLRGYAAPRPPFPKKPKGN